MISHISFLHLNLNKNKLIQKLNKGQLVTAVWQDCEFIGKFTFAFRKKFYL